jgi:hypothetical protein
MKNDRINLFADQLLDKSPNLCDIDEIRIGNTLEPSLPGYLKPHLAFWSAFKRFN